MQNNRKWLLPLAGAGLIGALALVMVVLLVALVIFTNQPEDSKAAPDTTEDNWWAYVFNFSTREVVKIDDAGQPVTVQVAGSGQIEDLAIAPNGVARAASCTVSENRNGGRGQATLHIIDLTTGQITTSVDMGQATFCRTSRYSFGPDGQTVAVAVVNFEQDLSPDVPSWLLKLVDVESGVVLTEINALQDRFQQALGDAEMNRFIIMPDVRLHEADRVIFALVPWGTEGFDVETAFEWQPATGDVAQVAMWGALQWDYLPATGEFAWLGIDDTLPAGQPGGPMPSFNVVRIYDQNGQARTLYHNAEMLPVDVQFIDGGRSLAILLLESFTPGQEGQQITQWIKLNRDGTTEALIETTGSFAQIAPHPNGFAMLHREMGPGEQRMYLALYENGTPRTLWESTDMAWQLVQWAAPQPEASELVPFAQTQ